jgi:hypothetical protein
LSVVACRRALFDRLGYFDESLKVVHDLDLYLRFLTSGGTTVHHSAELVEHAVPGGLVERHREWYREERALLGRNFVAARWVARDRRRIRAARGLFFARLAFTRGDLRFGLTRLAEAFARAPVDAIRIAHRAVRRRSSTGLSETLGARV